MSRHCLPRLLFFFFSALSLFAESGIGHAYLGVQASRLDRAISHQLDLPIGAHLQVEGIVPGSPAQEAGVQTYDVLLKLDDQLLINPEQLKTLVRMRKPGESVSLVLLRQTKPITLSVELMEAPENVRDAYDQNGLDDRDLFGIDKFFGPNDRARNFFRRHTFDFPDLSDYYSRPFFSDPRLEAPSAGPRPDVGSRRLDDPLHGGDVHGQSYSYSSSTKQVTVSDDDGSLQWTEKDGLRFLRATDLDGRVLFEGSITTEDDRKKLPAGVGKRLRTMQQIGQIPPN